MKVKYDQLNKLMFHVPTFYFGEEISFSPVKIIVYLLTQIVRGGENLENSPKTSTFN